MKTLRQLARRMERLDRELPRKVNEISKNVATSVLNEIVKSMPVDTSLAVSNWQLGYDEANMSNIPPHVPGVAGLTRGASSAETLLVGNMFIRGKRPGIELHISNGLDYIRDINVSSSMPGFKEAGLDAGRETLKNSKLSF